MDKILKQIKNTWNEISYETCIFLYLFLRFIIFMPTKMLTWVSTYYACNYSYGIIPRGFIGTIFKLVTGGDISSINAHSFAFVGIYILIILISILVGKMIRTVEEGTKRKTMFVLAIIYFFMPFSICYLFDEENFGRFDLYLYIITIVQILLIFKKPTFLKMIVCGVLSCICVMIHEAYALYIFPIFFVVLLYILYKNKFTKMLTLGSILILLMIFVTTVYFNFFTTINIDNSNEYISQLRKSTDLKINEYCIQYEYYMHSISDHKEYFIDRLITYNICGLLIVIFILILPINIVIFKFIKNALKEYKRKLFYYIIIVMLISTVVYIPLFVFTSDWGRWLASVYNCIIAIMSIILIENNEKILEIIKFEKTNKYVCTSKCFIIASIIFFTSSLGVFQTAGIYNWLFGIIKEVETILL